MAISLGGGGSASVINEVVYLNNTANTVTLADGRVYLKGGVAETTVASYPDATSSFGYQGTTFSVSQASRPAGLAYDGSHLFVLDRLGTPTVKKYTTAGAYVTSYTVADAGGSNETSGIVWDGTNFWILNGSEDRVYKYNSSFAYQNVNFSTASQISTQPRGIAFDGTYLWICSDSTTNSRAYKYNTSGVYQNENFLVGTQETFPWGITWDGSHFWVVGNNTKKAYKYTAAGVYTGLNFSFDSSVYSTGIVKAGTDFYILDYSGQSIKKFPPQILFDSNNTPAGVGQNYVRIK